MATAQQLRCIWIVSVICMADACIPEEGDPSLTESPFVSELECKAGRVDGIAAKHDFRILNKELFPLVVTSVRKNCGCAATSLVSGTVVDSKSELVVPVTLTARPAGGVEVGELWLELTSKSFETREVHLKFSAEFPRLIWAEIGWVDSVKAPVLRLTLRTRLPGLLSKFKKISLKPEVETIELVSVSDVATNDCIQFDFKVTTMETCETCELKERKKSLAVFEFDDQRVPSHSEFFEIPCKIGKN